MDFRNGNSLVKEEVFLKKSLKLQKRFLVDFMQKKRSLKPWKMANK